MACREQGEIPATRNLSPFEGEFPIRKLLAHSSRALNRLDQVAGS